MKYLILIVLTALALSGCVTTKYSQVKCNSGFKTPPSFLAYAHAGYVVWRESKNGTLKKKRIVPNENCKMLKVNK